MCRGRLLTPLEISPKQVNFGQIDRNGPTLYRTITILSGDGGSIAPEVLPGKTQSLSAQICEIEPGEHYELEVSFEPPFPKGKFRDKLNLMTGVDEAPNMTLMVSGVVTQRLTAVPDRFTFPTQRTDEVRQSIRLKWDNRGAANILDVESTIPMATVFVEDHGRGQRLVMTMPAGSERIRGSHSVTIKTDDPEVPTLSIPVTFKHKRAARGTQARPRPRTGRPKPIPKPSGGGG